jgi:hypothetical protein
VSFDDEADRTSEWILRGRARQETTTIPVGAGLDGVAAKGRSGIVRRARLAEAYQSPLAIPTLDFSRNSPVRIFPKNMRLSRLRRIAVELSVLPYFLISARSELAETHVAAP